MQGNAKPLIQFMGGSGKRFIITFIKEITNGRFQIVSNFLMY